CSCRLWPSPGMYAVTSMLLDSRTRATLRSAEFGFFGVTVRTWVQTPRFCGEPFALRTIRFFSVLNRKRSAGDFVCLLTLARGWRTNWLIVGTPTPYPCLRAHHMSDGRAR